MKAPKCTGPQPGCKKMNSFEILHQSISLELCGPGLDEVKSLGALNPHSVVVAPGAFRKTQCVEVPNQPELHC